MPLWLRRALHEWRFRALRFCFLCHVPVGIDLREALPLFWKVFDREDCRYRADWDAGTAVNAFIGIDVKLQRSRKLAFVFSWMNTITRADVHARSILCAHTRFGNYIRHSTLLGITEKIGPANPLPASDDGFQLKRQCRHKNAE